MSGSRLELTRGPVGDPAAVTEGFEVVRDAYIAWLNRRLRHESVTFSSSMMVGHNFMKFVLVDIAERSDITEAERADFFGIALKRLAQSLLSPEESRQAEQELRS